MRVIKLDHVWIGEGALALPSPIDALWQWLSEGPTGDRDGSNHGDKNPHREMANTIRSTDKMYQRDFALVGRVVAWHWGLILRGSRRLGTATAGPRASAARCFGRCAHTSAVRPRYITRSRSYHRAQTGGEVVAMTAP